jgi:hypothetical protein
MKTTTYVLLANSAGESLTRDSNDPAAMVAMTIQAPPGVWAVMTPTETLLPQVVAALAVVTNTEWDLAAPTIKSAEA